MEYNYDYFNRVLRAIDTKIRNEIIQNNLSIYNQDIHLENTPHMLNNTELEVDLAGISFVLNSNTDQLEATMDLSVLLIVKYEDAKNANETSLKFLEQILLIVKDGNWGVENTFSTNTNSISAKNQWQGNLVSQNTSMWQINWQQKCILGVDKFAETGSFPSAYHVKTNINNDNKIDEEYSGDI